ncbi:major facilitator superfamily domain-containing protein [Phascolomyces articulosus]|uniref:Major facilitator superfamily domain-containing protein n=1 Tax=Phascolomyces articulosus TaxID=60185 RepID=A0AAD5PF20_9FUNG|nr:major facilitator superfamily domain-containing protein [Phascolomyces articulosus]
MQQNKPTILYSFHYIIIENVVTIDSPSSEKNSHSSATHEDCESVRSKTLACSDEEKPADNNDKIPDGGYGWFIVVGAFLVQVTSVMQDYYEQNVFGDRVSNAPLQLSFVGTFCLIFSNAMGPVAQILQSMLGTRAVLFIGTIFIAVGVIIAGFSTEIWHLYLTQGICFGIGVSFMYVTIMSVAPQYFNRRRGFALGLIASGSGIGGLIMPFIMTPINKSLGGGWTYRVVGFICLACDLVACILVKDRIPRPRVRKRLGDIIKFSVFKDSSFRIWCLGATMQMVGYFIPFFFVPSHATYLGLSASQGSSMVAVSCAMNFVGRIVCGFLADKLGNINTNIIYLTIASLSNFLIWTFAYTYGTLVAFMAIFGFTCGSYFALVSPITASICGMEKFPTGLSMVLISNVIAVFGPNIASAIESGVSSERFFSYKMFAGVAYILSALIMTWLKFNVNRKPFAKV